MHGSVITPKDIKNFFNGLGNETNKLINSSLKYTGEVVKGIGKFIDKNLDTIGKVAITIGGAAVAVGAAGLAIGAMPVLILVGAGTIITGTMIAKGAIVVAGTSALVAATVGGVQTITGLLQKDLAGNIISVEESNNKISNGITNLVGSAMLAGSTYMLNSAYNSITAETVEKNIKVYRAINKEDYYRLQNGKSLIAKNPNGDWDLKMHLVRGSSKLSLNNDPYISTTTDMNVALEFNNKGSNFGVVEIDLNLIDGQYFKGYDIYPRLNGEEGLPYHYSVWQQEISIKGTIPIDAIRFIDYK